MSKESALRISQEYLRLVGRRNKAGAERLRVIEAMIETLLKLGWSRFHTVWDISMDRQNTTVMFETDGNSKADAKLLNQQKALAVKTLVKQWPKRKIKHVLRQGEKIWYLRVGATATSEGWITGIATGLRIPHTRTEAGDIQNIVKRVVKMEAPYQGRLQEKREADYIARKEQARADEELEKAARKRVEEEWYTALPPQGRKVFDNLKALKQVGKKQGDRWLLDFSQSLLEQFRSRSKLSPKQTAAVNRALDQHGVQREVSREETVKLKAQRKKNQPLVDRIKGIPGYQDKEIWVSFLRQLELGHVLSPNQIAVLDAQAPAPVQGDSVEADLRKFTALLNSKGIPALVQATREVDDEEDAAEVRKVWNQWKAGKKSDLDVADHIDDFLFRALLGGNQLMPAGWFFDLRSQIARALKPKPTKKALRAVGTMRALYKSLSQYDKSQLQEDIEALM